MNFLSKNLVPKREEGQGLVEYALLLVLVAIVVIAILSLVGTTVRDQFSTIIGALGGDGGYEYTITSPLNASSTDSGGGACTSSVSVSVSVTKDGAPVESGAVTGTFSGFGKVSANISNGSASWSESNTQCYSGTATFSVGTVDSSDPW